MHTTHRDKLNIKPREEEAKGLGTLNWDIRQVHTFGDYINNRATLSS